MPLDKAGEVLGPPVRNAVREEVNNSNSESVVVNISHMEVSGILDSDNLDKDIAVALKKAIGQGLERVF